jgi:hypothetical protein
MLVRTAFTLPSPNWHTPGCQLPNLRACANGYFFPGIRSSLNTKSAWPGAMVAVRPEVSNE